MRAERVMTIPENAQNQAQNYRKTNEGRWDLHKINQNLKTLSSAEIHHGNVWMKVLVVQREAGCEKMKSQDYKLVFWVTDATKIIMRVQLIGLPATAFNEILRNDAWIYLGDVLILVMLFKEMHELIQV